MLYTNISPDFKIPHSYNNDKASGLKALLYINNGIKELNTKTKIAYTEFAIEKLMNHAQILSYGKSATIKKGRFHLSYLMRQINLRYAKKINLSTKILCLAIKIHYSLFLILYKCIYLPFKKTKMNLFSRHKKSNSKLSYKELQNLAYQIKSHKYEGKNHSQFWVFSNKIKYWLKKVNSEINLKD